MKTTILLGVLTLSFGLLGCGGADDITGPSCDTTKPHLCYDGAISESEAQSTCTQLAGTYSAGPCTHANATGGCKTTVTDNENNRVVQIKWSYADSTDEMITAESCAAEGGTYVAP